MTVRLDRPWLEMDLGAPHRVLSWSLNAPGFATATRILWREVKNADLPPDLDAGTWLDRELAERGNSEEVAMLTSRDLGAFEVATATAGEVTADCVATVGLSNAERVGTRMDRSGKVWGTINIAVRISLPLADSALIEAMSVAAQARTAAVIKAGHRLPTGIATGTGTDCIAVAAKRGRARFAGLHTDTGAAVGRAVYDAVQRGARAWVAENSHRRAD